MKRKQRKIKVEYVRAMPQPGDEDKAIELAEEL